MQQCKLVHHFLFPKYRNSEILKINLQLCAPVIEGEFNLSEVGLEAKCASTASTVATILFFYEYLREKNS